jgi:hypothetical protein
MAKINDGTLKDWKNGDKVTSDLYEADREILRVANNDNHDRIVRLEVDKPVQDKTVRRPGIQRNRYSGPYDVQRTRDAEPNL